MTNTCMDCIQFDDCNTSLSVCLLHKCFKRGDDTCGDFMPVDGRDMSSMGNDSNDDNRLGEVDG